MAFWCPVLVPVSISMKGFCILLVPILVPVPVLVTASVIRPLQVKTLMCINNVIYKLGTVLMDGLFTWLSCSHGWTVHMNGMFTWVELFTRMELLHD